MRSKAETFLGFAIRKRGCALGMNSAEATRGVRLVIVSDDASDNTKKDAAQLAARRRCPLMLSKIPLERIAGKENCKVAAVTDPQLAAAIYANADENFIVLGGRNGNGGQGKGEKSDR